MLKNQIMAFKLLNKNLPIPAHIRQAIVGGLKSQVAQEAVEDVVYTDTLDSESYIKTISYDEHSDRANRPVIPTLIPLGVSFEAIVGNREQAIANRVMNRIVELQEIPTNIEGIRFDTEERDLKTRLLIEYKGLKLLNKQKAIREKMLHNLPSFLSLAATHDRAQYRRLKSQSLRESRATSDFERQQKIERERREKQKHFDYLAGVTAHAEEVREESNTVRAKAQKMGKAVLSYHTYIEKEEQRRYERLSKQRVAALKANDEAAYLALVDTAKDTRIAHLLKQTNQYLDSLAEQIKAQQGHSAGLGPRGPMELEEEPEEEETTGEKTEEAQEQDYYQIAHKVKETITEQPGILVGGSLKSYQIQGLQWMVSLYNNRLNGILADEMGLGKTIQTISLITFLIEKKKQNGPFLVIVPLSTLTNWTLEFEKWAPSVHKIVYKGAPSTRKTLSYQVRQGAFQVLLTTYEYIIKDRAVLARIKWVHMIIDEGHRMKNANSKLTTTLVQYYNTRHRLILTGTPLQNNLPELWALLNFVLPKIFNSVKSFDEWFNTPFANTGGSEKIELSEEESLLVIRRLHKVLRPFLLRRLKKDVEKDLPDKVENVIKCQLSGLQKKLYDQMKKHGMLFVSEEGKNKQGIKGLNNTLMQLRKICNHPFVFEEVERSIVPNGGNNDQLWRVSGKFELLDRILPKFQRTGHRVLMFFQMTQIMNIMEDFLHYRGLKYMRLDGSTKADDRSALLKDFNAPDSEYFVFLLSTRAGGLGLNLQTADTVIIFDSDWNPHQDLQAQDRAHRIGQTKEVRILRLITEKSIEESILARAQYKLDMDGKVIQAGKFDNKSTAEEREAFLRALLDSDPAAADDEKDSDRGEDYEDDEDLNEIIARNDDELKLFREMDIDRDMAAQYGPGHKLPRLMLEKELPSAYHKDRETLVDDFFAIAGPGKRERKETAYDDGLTEEEWLRAVDSGEDPSDLGRRGRGARNKKQDDFSAATSPGASSTASSKKRNRHSRAQSSDPSESRKRVRTSVGPSNLRDMHTKPSLTTKLFQTIINYMDEAVAPDGHGRTDIFQELPPKKTYPDYYITIAKPISLAEIREYIEDENYGINDFRRDFELMFMNARQYNEEGSFIWDDVHELERILQDQLSRYAPNDVIDPASLEDDSESDS